MIFLNNLIVRFVTKFRYFFIVSAVIIFAEEMFIKASLSQDMGFGGKEDTKFANDLWKVIKNYPDWPFKTELMKGESPHGKYVMSFYNIVKVGNKQYHVIVKDGFGKDNVSKEDIIKSPEKNITGITVMVQREAGYDPKAQDWYWVGYKGRNGEVSKTPKDMAIAGKFPMCISCHEKAKGGDLVFTNDGK